MEKPGILVVDDDREIVKAIAINLEKEGYRVYEAYNGLQALDVLNNNSIQLILLDIMMPGLTGLSATLKIREERNIPIINLSAKSETATKSWACQWSRRHVTKPFNPLISWQGQGPAEGT